VDFVFGLNLFDFFVFVVLFPGNSDYDEIDRSDLKDLVGLINSDAEDSNDNEVAEDVDVVGNVGNVGNVENVENVDEVDLNDSNENNKDEKMAEKVKDKNKKIKSKKEKAFPSLEENTKVIVPKLKNIEIPVNLTVAAKSVQNDREKAEQHNLTISEAFADDDVIEEFRAEKVCLIFCVVVGLFWFYFKKFFVLFFFFKKSIVDNEKVKAIDLTMPGWGDWGGAGIDPSKTKKTNTKRRFGKNNQRLRRNLVIKPEDVLTTEEDKMQMTRRDKELEHVIISEKKDLKIAAYQVGLFEQKRH